MTDETKLPEAENAQQTRYGRRILFALSRSGQHVYAGTVSFKDKMKRRAKDKVAKRSRKLNRGNNRGR